jgi:natural product biosynthesis luciferase-like monooxygenase protein
MAMKFGVMFFSAEDRAGGNKYELLLETARFADTHDFCAVWTPERHFHPFGGLYPNPALTSAALATITSRIQLRAGSLISPLHHAIRIAEEWAVVDNLSSGRVGVSFGSGWNVNDFVFYPERYQTRQAVMYEQIATVKRLWRGEQVTEINSFGKPVDVVIYPKPVQTELPIWVTSSGNPETFRGAGKAGANLLTHLIGQDPSQLAGKIAEYRKAWTEAGHAGRGTVSLMLHTFMGTNLDAVRAAVHTPFREYLRSALSLEQLAAVGGGAISGGHKIAPQEVPADMIEDLLDLTFERYFKGGSLMGTVESCEPTVQRLMDAGVDEAACLIDFGVGDTAAVLKSLAVVNELRELFSTQRLQASADAALRQFAQPLE